MQGGKPSRTTCMNIIAQTTTVPPHFHRILTAILRASARTIRQDEKGALVTDDFPSAVSGTKPRNAMTLCGATGAPLLRMLPSVSDLVPLPDHGNEPNDKCVDLGRRWHFSKRLRTKLTQQLTRLLRQVNHCTHWSVIRPCARPCDGELPYFIRVVASRNECVLTPTRRRNQRVIE